MDLPDETRLPTTPDQNTISENPHNHFCPVYSHLPTVLTLGSKQSRIQSPKVVFCSENLTEATPAFKLRKSFIESKQDNKLSRDYSTQKGTFTRHIPKGAKPNNLGFLVVSHHQSVRNRDYKKDRMDGGNAIG